MRSYRILFGSINFVNAEIPASMSTTEELPLSFPPSLTDLPELRDSISPSFDYSDNLVDVYKSDIS